MKLVNIYIVYEQVASGFHTDDHMLKICFFGAVTLTKNGDIDKYQYSGYGIWFDKKSNFLFPVGGFGQNVIIFEVHMSSSAHVDNNKKDILITGNGPTQRLEDILTAEKMCSINFTVNKKELCLRLHYNGAKSYLLVNGTEIYKFNAKILKL